MPSKESKLSQFPLHYETTKAGDELIAEAIANRWLKNYRKVVLIINKVGLLPIARFRVK